MPLAVPARLVPKPAAGPHLRRERLNRLEAAILFSLRRDGLATGASCALLGVAAREHAPDSGP